MSCCTNSSLLLGGIDGIIPYFDAIINEWGKPCTVFYNPTITPCSCPVSPLGDIPRPAWIDGGPSYQPNPLCSLCSGQGSVTQENKDIVQMVINTNPKEFNAAWKAQLTRLPDGLIECKGFIADLPKIVKCIYMRTPLQEYIEYKFTLAAEPVSVEKILQNRYFTSLWSRIS